MVSNMKQIKKESLMDYLNKKTVIEYMACVLAALIFVGLFSYSTSPLFGIVDTTDSYIFQIIGKYWNKGIIPYVGLFDHKGPIIFFINAVGYHITGNRYGVFIIQVILFSIFVGCMFKIYNKEFSKVVSWILVVVSLFGLVALYEEGNLTEEYILPLLMLAFNAGWGYINRAMNGQIWHRPIIGLFYGVIVGVCLMTRATNAIGVCILVMVIAVQLVIGREWKNLIQNIFTFIAGMLAIIMPFVVYFAYHNALNDMWFGTIGFNISYVENSGTVLSGLSLKRIITLGMYFFSSYSLMFVGILTYISGKRCLMGISMIVISAVTSLMFIAGRAYPHYCMICVPYFVFSILELKKLDDNVRHRKMINIVIVIFLMIFIIGGAYSMKERYNVVHKITNDNAVMELINSVPEKERDSFVAYQCPVYLYLKYDILPYYRYFILQDSQAEVSEELQKRIYELYNSGNVKWILTIDGVPDVIKEVLDRRYDCVKKAENYLLYNLK